MKRHHRLAIAFCLAATSSGMSEAVAQQRIPGWGRVAPPGEHQMELQLLRPSGGPVIPIFEGWYTNADGTHQLCFGYFNTNTEEIKEIPIGPDNFIEPAEFNGLQPTHFMPVPPGSRRHYCVFSITVPADWGEKDLVWTLMDRGQAFTSPGRLRFSTYNLEEPLQPARRRVAPTIRLPATGQSSMGRTGVVMGPIETSVGKPLPLSVQVRRDNPFNSDDRAFIGLKWLKYQGPGKVGFTVLGDPRMAGDRALVPAETWMDSESAWGELMTEAVFDTPGEYTLIVQAYNESGGRLETSDFEFFCCWTNAYLRVDVAP